MAPSTKLPLDASLDRRAAASQIAERVRESILRGDMAPGRPLREADLAAAFHVTRNTVREALRLLSQEGLTSHEVHRGVAVRRLTAAEIKQVFGVRAIVEGAVAERAGSLTSAEIASLQAPLIASERAAERSHDYAEVLRQNLEFHRRLVALVGNSRLDQVFDELAAEVTLALVCLHTDVAGPWLQRNRELLRLLSEGKARQFRSEMRCYLDDSLEDVLTRIKKDSRSIS
jgi:DNA-binding GntR family transcriptional regulator